MVTFKIGYTSDKKLQPMIAECNKIRRIAFSLFKKYECPTVVSNIIKNKYNINYDLVDASILSYQIGDAFIVYKTYKENKHKKFIFGTYHQWKRLQRGLISKEDFKNIRDDQPIQFNGASNEYLGNRKMKMDIQNERIIFKRTRNDHYNINLNIKKSRLNYLQRLQIFFDAGGRIPVTYKLQKDYIYITFEN